MSAGLQVYVFRTIVLCLVLGSVEGACAQTQALASNSVVGSTAVSVTANTKPAAPSASPSKESVSNLPSQSTDEKLDPSYIVGIADELQISVWKEPDLSNTVVVRPDGMITLPVIDDVKVVGLTTKRVQEILTEKLKNVVDGPQVTVIVKNIRSRKVYLVGQVGHPGAVALNAHETVLQVLAESGGPGPYAKTDKIYILRNIGDHQEKLSFNYKKAVKGGDPNADFPLISGDVIVVP